jgi:hypothetical protein
MASGGAAALEPELAEVNPSVAVAIASARSAIVAAACAVSEASDINGSHHADAKCCVCIAKLAGTRPPKRKCTCNSGITGHHDRAKGARFRSPSEMPAHAPSVTLLKTRWNLARLRAGSCHVQEHQQQGPTDTDGDRVALQISLEQASASGDLQRVQSLMSCATEYSNRARALARA